MELTKISIKLKQKEEEPNLLASAEITLNDVFVVHGIKIVKDKEKLIVKMPYRNSKTGREEEIVRPKTRTFRNYISKSILEAYQKEISA